MLKSCPAGGTKKQHVLLNRAICQQAFRKLIGLGAQRYTRLRKAARDGDLLPPLDGRCVAPKQPHASARRLAVAVKRARICEFLAEIRCSVAEPMPEANQRLRDLKASMKFEGELPKVNLKFFRRSRGKRPRRAAALHRNSDPSKIRLLPPGSFNDYLQLMRTRNPDMSVSKKLFNKVGH